MLRDAVAAGCLICSHFEALVAKLRKATVSFDMSVRPSVSPSVCPHGTTGQIFMKFDI
jgi:hypothetical protein